MEPKFIFPTILNFSKREAYKLIYFKKKTPDDDFKRICCLTYLIQLSNKVAVETWSQDFHFWNFLHRRNSTYSFDLFFDRTSCASFGRFFFSAGDQFILPGDRLIIGFCKTCTDFSKSTQKFEKTSFFRQFWIKFQMIFGITKPFPYKAISLRQQIHLFNTPIFKHKKVNTMQAIIG